MNFWLFKLWLPADDNGDPKMSENDGAVLAEALLALCKMKGMHQYMILMGIFFFVFCCQISGFKITGADRANDAALHV